MYRRCCHHLLAVISAKADYYSRLGVEPDADTQAIKVAFRRLALQHHPDVADAPKNAKDNFALLAQAYETLSDPSRRADYDGEKPFKLQRAEGSTASHRKKKKGGKAGVPVTRPKQRRVFGKFGKYYVNFRKSRQEKRRERSERMKHARPSDGAVVERVTPVYFKPPAGVDYDFLLGWRGDEPAAEAHTAADGSKGAKPVPGPTGTRPTLKDALRASRMWFALGAAVLRSGNALFDSRAFADSFSCSAFECFLSSLQCFEGELANDNHQAAAWVEVGKMLLEVKNAPYALSSARRLGKIVVDAELVTPTTKGIPVRIEDEVFDIASPRDCFVAALESDPTIPGGWFYLGETLMSSSLSTISTATVRIVAPVEGGGGEMEERERRIHCRKLDCYIRELMVNDPSAIASAPSPSIALQRQIDRGRAWLKVGASLTLTAAANNKKPSLFGGFGAGTNRSPFMPRPASAPKPATINLRSFLPGDDAAANLSQVDCILRGLEALRILDGYRPPVQRMPASNSKTTPSPPQETATSVVLSALPSDPSSLLSAQQKAQSS